MQLHPTLHLSIHEYSETRVEQTGLVSLDAKLDLKRPMDAAELAGSGSVWLRDNSLNDFKRIMYLSMSYLVHSMQLIFIILILIQSNVE